VRGEIPDVSSAPQTLSERVKGLALAVGFDLAGIARAEPTPESEFLREWLARGLAGEMHYLGRRVEERVDPRRVLEGARSVVAVGLVYDSGPGPASEPGAFRVARYAGGEDYHDVLLDRVRALEAGLPALAGRSVRSRGYVDTGPVQERVFAASSGLGWIGRNTCLIHPRLGSPRRVPHRRVSAALRSRCEALHLLCDDRGAGRHSRAAARSPGRLGLRLRCLPGGLPLEPP